MTVEYELELSVVILIKQYMRSTHDYYICVNCVSFFDDIVLVF